MVVRAIDVAAKRELWASKPIPTDQIVAGRARNADPGIDVVNDLLDYVDENLTLGPLTPLTPPAAETSATAFDRKEGNYLLKIATIRAYQCQGWITDDQAAECYSRFLDREGEQTTRDGRPEWRHARGHRPITSQAALIRNSPWLLMPLLGSHLSIAGGYYKAVEGPVRSAAIACKSSPRTTTSGGASRWSRKIARDFRRRSSSTKSGIRSRTIRI